MRSVRLSIPILAAAGIAALWSPRAPVLIWNASASAPLGLYALRHAAHLAYGDLVLAEPSSTVARLAARRGYLPRDVPLVKRIAALAGDTVCGAGARITINGHEVATWLAADSRGRLLSAWRGCQTLRSDQVFLLMEGVPDSFDGRYFGPISRAAVLGTLRPLWTH